MFHLTLLDTVCDWLAKKRSLATLMRTNGMKTGWNGCSCHNGVKHQNGWTMAWTLTCSCLCYSDKCNNCLWHILSWWQYFMTDTHTCLSNWTSDLDSKHIMIVAPKQLHQTAIKYFLCSKDNTCRQKKKIANILSWGTANTSICIVNMSPPLNIDSRATMEPSGLWRIFWMRTLTCR